MERYEEGIPKVCGVPRSNDFQPQTLVFRALFGGHAFGRVTSS